MPSKKRLTEVFLLKGMLADEHSVSCITFISYTYLVLSNIYYKCYDFSHLKTSANNSVCIIYHKCQLTRVFGVTSSQCERGLHRYCIEGASNASLYNHLAFGFRCTGNVPRSLTGLIFTTMLYIISVLIHR